MKKTFLILWWVTFLLFLATTAATPFLWKAYLKIGAYNDGATIICALLIIITGFSWAVTGNYFEDEKNK
ncbi:MAG: hypothetical protein EBX41_10505 [Chitinophagia bacterium]|nr:hypothetical protein [Chitinophagia bacterium]